MLYSRWDSNPQPSVPKTDALPLSHWSWIYTLPIRTRLYNTPNTHFSVIFLHFTWFYSHKILLSSLVNGVFTHGNNCPQQTTSRDSTCYHDLASMERECWQEEQNSKIKILEHLNTKTNITKTHNTCSGRSIYPTALALIILRWTALFASSSHFTFICSSSVSWCHSLIRSLWASTCSYLNFIHWFVLIVRSTRRRLACFWPVLMHFCLQEDCLSAAIIPQQIFPRALSSL